MSRVRDAVFVLFLWGIAPATQAQTMASAPPGAASPAPNHAAMDIGMDSGILTHGVLDLFEGRVGGGQNAFRWGGEGWIGNDYDKLWFKSEGFARGNGRVDDGRHELLYDRAISGFTDLQVGVRTDWASTTGRTWAAFGVRGLAPLFVNYEATGYLSDNGQSDLRLAASVDLPITQRLILRPEAEMNFRGKTDPGQRVGSGLSDIDTGIRLRYEISRKFAPYIGVVYAGRFGQTANFARKEGEGSRAVRRSTVPP